MSLLESERVRELLVRAGLGGLNEGALKGVMIAASAVIAIGVWRFWPAAPAPEIAFSETEVNVSAEEVPAVALETCIPEVVIHVAGAVMHPGVYELPAGSRVADALSAAGGSLGLAATDSVNLARLLTDGEQVYLPTQEEVANGAFSGAADGGGGNGASGNGLVNINTASASELDALPGIGIATAQKIVDDREANGPFGKPEDLMRVPGIGQSKFDSLKDLVTAG